MTTPDMTGAALFRFRFTALATAACRLPLIWVGLRRIYPAAALAFAVATETSGHRGPDGISDIPIRHLAER